MPGQSVIPGTDKHEATENVLEGSVIRIRLKAHSLFECIGNIFASLGAMKIPTGELFGDKAGAILFSKPLAKRVSGAFNTIRIPLGPTELGALSGHIEEQE
ncbi:hypothetical protein X943_000312 [Babesia divergens]|uniref:Uncharacterized protein n=1 Tax=Babesia divergens TaxID=32595 RepID=A0AAD9GBD9_BABDI|nr:hypothetical protein X943_000312 [Babesia divergens]